jgi:NAD-dependent SIR2 family protein deacetylase
LDCLDGVKRFTKRVECEACRHQFDAVFFKKDSEANEVESCLVCGARDFKFIEFGRKTIKEGRGVEKK